MTSIAHPVLPGAVPAVGGSSTSSASAERRLLQPSGSKAVRVGLGVAIAAVMAGDVYAVLRSPVSEGRGAGTSAASAAGLEDGSGAAGRFASTAGHVAMNPFSDAAFGASHGPGSGAGGPLVVARAAAPAVTTTPAAATTMPSAPAPAARIVLPTAPASPAFTPSTFNPAQTEGTGPGNPSTDDGETTPPPAAGPLAPIAEAIKVLPFVGEPAADIVTEIDTQVPPTPAPVADTVETVIAPVAAVPSTVSSSLGL